MMRAIAIFLMLAGCAHYPPTHSTPKYGIDVHIRAGVDVDPLTVLMWVDLRADEWLKNRAAWGCGDFNDAVMIGFLNREPVIVFPGHDLDPLPDCPYIGYNATDGLSPQIHVTVSWPTFISYSELANGVGIGVVPFDYSYGLRQLPHEWTHTARGRWHN